MKPKLKNHYRAHKLSFWLNLVPELHRSGSQDMPTSHHMFKSDIDKVSRTTKSQEFAIMHGPEYKIAKNDNVQNGG
jgi:hypothetical protein